MYCLFSLEGFAIYCISLSFTNHSSVKISILWFQVNAVMGELFTSEVLGRTVPEKSQSQIDPDKASSLLYDWSAGLEDADDSHLYFSPDQGNVIFASAVDGWGFG